MNHSLILFSAIALFQFPTFANESTCKEKVAAANQLFSSEDYNALLQKATEAVSECEKANVKSAPAYVVLGAANLKLGKTSDALTAFKKASKIDPVSEIIQINLCSTYATLNDEKNAKIECNKSMKGTAFQEQAKTILNQLTGSHK